LFFLVEFHCNNHPHTKMEQDNNNNNNNNDKINNNNNENKNGGGEINNVSYSKEENFFDFSPKRSIAERRGFNKINTGLVRFGATTPLVSPAIRSPWLTIPPGISPTALLESPVMLPNSQV
jgi:WRKY transcription factor 2